MGHAKDYPYIRAWGRLMHSNHSYIQDQEALARVEHAPANAIFKREDGWRTYDDITTGDVKTMVAETVAAEKRRGD